MYRLIAEHERFIVISKAPGVSVHRDQSTCGLVTQIERDRDEKLWLVHRLDRITSGLMLLARSAADCAALTALFGSRQIEKFYIALSDRKPVRKQGQVIGDLARGRRGSWKLLRSRENPAITEFYSQSAAPGVRLFLCKPFTGKTHQIRVALKSVGAPIIGDSIYHEQVEPVPERGYLHAWQLYFCLNGEAFHFVAPPDCGALFCSTEVHECLAVWSDPRSLKWRFHGGEVQSPVAGVGKDQST